MEESASRKSTRTDRAIVAFMRELMKLEHLKDSRLALWAKHEWMPGPGGYGFYREHELFLTEVQYESTMKRLGYWLIRKEWPIIARTRSIYGRVEAIEFEDKTLAQAAEVVHSRMKLTRPELDSIKITLV